MTFRALFKYGLPLSFVYCTVYQQDIWREGDDRLVEEQKKTWRKFFSTIDSAYQATKTKLNLHTTSSDSSEVQSFLARFDSLDMRSCWNSKILSAFAAVDQVTSNPKLTACRIYRKLQPYVSSPHVKAANSENVAIKE